MPSDSTDEPSYVYCDSCTRCGYCEFYTAGDADVIVDLFLGG